jgi:beta-lactamase superfamily II metal-dependent hydrolase
MGDNLALIDCGYRRIGGNIIKTTNIGDYIKDNIGKDYIDLMIITHPHYAHFLGMQDLIGKFWVGEFWETRYDRRSGDSSLDAEEWNEYCQMKEKLVPEKDKRLFVTKGDNKKIGKCEFVVLGPRDSVNNDANRGCHDAGLIIWVEAPANTFLICGDASDFELDMVMADWNLYGVKCNVLHASHHGSEKGANPEFIKLCSPRDTIISTQSGVIENMPSDIALQRYKEHSAHILRTDIDGTCITQLASF